MNRKPALLLLPFAASLLAAPAAHADARGSAKPAAARPTPTKPAVGTTRKAGATSALPLLVDPAWLAARLDDPTLVLLHVGDADAYRKQHIRGARLVTLGDVSQSGKMGEGLILELPPADELRRRLEALGISDGSTIVITFGDDWVSPATRVLLTLDAAGLGARAALLDGGTAAWLAAGHPTTEAVPAARPGKLSPLAIRPIITDATNVLASLGKPGFAVVDARDREFYEGSKAGGMIGHTHRAGHITGALSIPYTSVVDEKHVLRSTDELRALFAKAGVKPGDTVITYCHIGQQATATLLAARLLGHPALLYDGAFEDWSQFHPSYPVEKSPGVVTAPPQPMPASVAKQASSIAKPASTASPAAAPSPTKPAPAAKPAEPRP